MRLCDRYMVSVRGCQMHTYAKFVEAEGGTFDLAVFHSLMICIKWQTGSNELTFNSLGSMLQLQAQGQGRIRTTLAICIGHHQF